VLERYDSVPQPSRLSAPALEVLAIIAYRQPLGRAEIEEIRGVGSSGVLRTLTERSLVEPVARGEGLGRPLLYGTTKQVPRAFRVPLAGGPAAAGRAAGRAARAAAARIATPLSWPERARRRRRGSPGRRGYGAGPDLERQPASPSVRPDDSPEAACPNGRCGSSSAGSLTCRRVRDASR
jgi:hypothetical protein